MSELRKRPRTKQKQIDIETVLYLLGDMGHVIFHPNVVDIMLEKTKIFHYLACAKILAKSHGGDLDIKTFEFLDDIQKAFENKKEEPNP